MKTSILSQEPDSTNTWHQKSREQERRKTGTAYKIAIATSDGIHINQTFGQASEFTIVTVADDSGYSVTEQRTAIQEQSTLCDTDRNSSCGSGCHMGGCPGGDGEIPKVTLISDCRCIICRKIGFQVQKQLEKKAILGLDVECGVDEALGNIIRYFERVDHHLTLRGFSRGDGKRE